MKKFIVSAVTTCVTAAALATVLAASTASAAPLSFQTLSLINNWKTYSPDVRAPKVAIDQDGVVRFMGAIKSGTTSHAFTLPAAFRPTKIVYVTTNLCLAAPGRLKIDPNGTVIVQSDGAFSSAQCFTSLEGVTFAK